MALKAGCDVNCGSTYLHILKAYQDGLVTEEDITRAAQRLFTTRFLLGCFDETEFDRIPYEAVSYTHLDVYKRQVYFLTHFHQLEHTSHSSTSRLLERI